MDDGADERRQHQRGQGQDKPAGAEAITSVEPFLGVPVTGKRGAGPRASPSRARRRGSAAAEIVVQDRFEEGVDGITAVLAPPM